MNNIESLLKPNPLQGEELQAWLDSLDEAGIEKLNAENEQLRAMYDYLKLHYPRVLSQAVKDAYGSRA